MVTSRLARGRLRSGLQPREGGPHPRLYIGVRVFPTTWAPALCSRTSTGADCPAGGLSPPSDSARRQPSTSKLHAARSQSDTALAFCSELQ